MVSRSPKTRRPSRMYTYKIPAIVFLVFWFGKFCLEKTAQIMIVNSFPPVPRMDHVLHEHDRYQGTYLFIVFLRRIQYPLLLSMLLYQAGTNI